VFGRLSSHEREQPSVGCLACDTSSWSFDASKTVVRGWKQCSRRQIGCSTVVYWARGSVAPVSRKCRHRLSPPPPRPRACIIPRCVSRAMSLGRIRFRDRKPCAPRFAWVGPTWSVDETRQVLLHCIVPVTRRRQFHRRSVASCRAASSSCFHFCTRSHGDG